jgi:hypothetical protein
MILIYAMSNVRPDPVCSRVYGSEGAPGVVEINEVEYRKLGDGNFQITKRLSEWSRSGLTGKAMGLPRNSSSVQLFQAIP